MVAMIENYTFSVEAQINLDERWIKTSYKIFLFPLNFKPESRMGVLNL
jgi:hypothetical protein